jgi:multicomponent K+:H+ antiporter subunit G
MTAAIVAILLVVGAFFALVGSIGLVRLPDFYSRLHGPTKATTLGVGSMLAASAVHFTVATGAPSVHEVLVLLFLFLTAPVSAHLVAKSAIHLRVDAAVAGLPGPDGEEARMGSEELAEGGEAGPPGDGAA